MPTALLHDQPVTHTLTIQAIGATEAVKALRAIPERADASGITMLLGDLMHLTTQLGLDFEQLRDDAEDQVRQDRAIDRNAGLAGFTKAERAL